MTDKHTAEQSHTVCVGVDWPVCDVCMLLIKLEITISFTEKSF